MGLVRNGSVDPLAILTQYENLSSAVEAYEQFDRRKDGWTKVAFDAQAVGR